MFRFVRFQAETSPILFAWLVLCNIICLAQKAPIKFGDVPLEDLKMKTYAKDSSAVAVVLADYGESSMVYSEDNGFTLSFERITRIKILKKEGLEWGNFSIPLYHSGGNDEKIFGLRAVTYNLESGKVVETKMKSDAVFKEKYDENIDFMKVALPNVRTGSVIEISYKLLSDFIFNFQDWEFQSLIPVKWSEYRAIFPEYFNYEKYTQGYVPLVINESKSLAQKFTIVNHYSESGMGARGVVNDSYTIDSQSTIQRWAAKDVPAFKEEPFLTNYRDYISKINFELASIKYPDKPIKYYMGNWEDINKTYLDDKNLGALVSGNPHLKDDAVQIVSRAASPEEKILLIHKYVRDNFQWDGTTRKYTDDLLRKVMEDRKGSSAELNLLMASMLEKVDVEVYPVLISTRDHGFIRETIPVSSQFNNTICLAKAGGKLILLDATQKLLPTGSLPERCLNGRGFVVSKSGHTWVELTAASKSRSTILAEVTLKGNMFSGKLSIDRTGYFAEKERSRYNQKGESDYVKDWVGSKPWEISKSSFDNVNQLEATLKQTHELSISEFATIIGNQVYFSPFFIERFEENPFKLEKREYPVNFGSPFDRVHMSKITIPEDYTIEEIPTPKAIALPYNKAKFFFNATQNNNIITITSTLQINQSLYTQDEYVALREFYSVAVAKHAEQIVLKKK